jgi:hypothetical protein
MFDVENGTPLEAAANVARIAMHERGIARGSSMQMMHTVSSGERQENGPVGLTYVGKHV